MSLAGTLVRRHFEPLLLFGQVLIDLAVVMAACYVGVWLGRTIGGPELPDYAVYTKFFALTGGVCLLAFNAFGMYSPVKSLLNVEEFKAILKSTVISFLVVTALLIFLQSTRQAPDQGIYALLVPLHGMVDMRLDPASFSRLTILLIFVLILVMTSVSRFLSFKVIQTLHRRGIGNRNALIFGTGATARMLERKFLLVPTLGLRLMGFATEEADEVGRTLDRSPVLGTLEDLPELVARYKISEVFVALPEAPEERVMEVLEQLERLGIVYRVVPRFYHLMSQRVRIEKLDSVPLISPADRRQSRLNACAKRVMDLCLGSLVVVLCAPLFLLAAILIKRDSPGPVFFRQMRVGRDGKPFRMFKFRTMHTHMSGDAPTPTDEHDPRVTHVGHFLRRYSLDELPQFLNVIQGSMSIVGPRPEMGFIVESYGPLDRERLRVKPGITGLWQISYARKQAIHETLDYDIYYVENHSVLLDLVIISLTVPAVLKGTGAL